MVSGFYLLSIAATCFLLMQVCSSMVIDDRYLPLVELGDIDEQAYGPSNNDQIYLARRSAHFIFPPTSFIHPSSRINDYRPIKRQSFGRKHHWDAFFG